jgi:pimeloyl-ACP methyl ester carboxylesterase
MAWLSAFFFCTTANVTATNNSPTTVPTPSGPFGVSRIAYDWIDTSRVETAIEGATGHRELMVYLWYPTDKKSKAAQAGYLPGAGQIAKSGKDSDEKDFWGEHWSDIVANKVTTTTSERVKVAAGSAKFPLLVFVPGLGLSSTAYTSMIQELVSLGYIVASVEPTYEVAAIAFPDGRVITQQREATGRGAPSPPNETREQFLKRLHAFDAGHLDRWAQDIRFVIDQTIALNRSTGVERAPFAGRVDVSSIGALGHSFGGRAAARACQIDPRIKACLDADGLGPDGPIFMYEGAKLATQPFMWIEVFHAAPTDMQLASFELTRAEWNKNHEEQLMKNENELGEYPGPSYHIAVNLPGIEHFSFTDEPLITAKTKEARNRAADTLTILTGYVRGFFDRYLMDGERTPAP